MPNVPRLAMFYLGLPELIKLGIFAAFGLAALVVVLVMRKK